MYNKAHMDAQKRLKFMMETDESDENTNNGDGQQTRRRQSNYSKVISGLLNHLYNVSGECVDNLFCRNLSKNCHTVYELLEKKFNELKHIMERREDEYEEEDEEQEKPNEQVNVQQAELETTETASDENVNEESEAKKSGSTRRPSHMLNLAKFDTMFKSSIAQLARPRSN